MKVLLTRPQGRNQSMAAALEQKGVSYMVAPLIEVIPANDSVGQQLVSQADIVIFISTNAVDFAFQQASLPWPKQATYVAVGQATLNALHSNGIPAISAPDNNQKTEGLLALTELQLIKNRNIVIVRGLGGRECLAEQLTLREANVAYWQVYQRVQPTLLSSADCQCWQEFGVDTIIATSGEILKNLLNLTKPHHQAWLKSCHLIVPSQRVAQIALAFDDYKITIAQGANTVSTLQALGLNN